MAKCSFCRDELSIGTGKMFVRGDGKIFYFCGSKCQGNFGLGRDPAHTKWVTSKGKKKA